MVKGPVPVSPAIAATFNAMTPSGAQLTSFFFFFFFFLPTSQKNFYQTAHKRKSCNDPDHFGTPKKSLQVRETKRVGPKILVSDCTPPVLPPPPHTHTQVQRRRGSSRTPRASKLRSKEKAQIHTRARKNQKETKKATKTQGGK